MSKDKDLLLHTVIEKEGDLYSAICLELNVASQGKTIDEAKANLREAVELYLEDVYETGDEKEFIPRPAPVEEWLKYFQAEARQLSSKIKGASLKIEFDEMVYA
jgi:predicted RNase H-like HicB family nuclease